jgi:hypothetical protein
MKKQITIFLLLFIVFISQEMRAQQEDMEPDHTYKPLQVKLNEDGSKYVRFIMWHQLWMESNSNQESMRFSIRRSRFLAYAQISPRFLILTHFGLNSLGANTLTGNPNTQTDNQRSMLFLHDAWGEFAIEPGKLYVGAGLHYWNGISRLTNQSTLNMMTLDNPGAGNSDVRLFPWNNITTSDQFARHLGIYAKGTLGKLQYRISANNARNNIGVLGAEPTYQVDNAADNADGLWNFAGYFKYDFLDQESDKLPYFVGSYLGKKKVFSVGAGFFHHPNALAVNSLDNRESVTHFAVDAFYDAPLNDKLAISTLGAYYNYGFGSTDGFNTGGLVPSSGSIVHGQVGLLFREHKLMPYVTYNSADLDFSPEVSNELGIGLNYFINDHFAKITAEFTTGSRGFTGVDSTNIFRIQAHIFL